MQQIIGKLNNDAYMIRYKGAKTDTAIVNIDNGTSTISVNVLGLDELKTFIKDNYYSKAEVDALLNGIRNELQLLATKDELAEQREAIMNSVSAMLTDYATTAFVNNKLSRYVTDVPATTISDDKIYGRQHGEWVEIKNAYTDPTIEEFQVEGIKTNYKYGETVSLTGVTHKEKHIEHIEALKLYRNIDVISNVTPSAEEVTDTSVTESFIAQSDFTYKLELKSESGKTYLVVEVLVDSTPYMYTGISSKDTLEAEDLDAFNYEVIITDKKYRYQLENTEFVWWCTPFRINSILQDGSYPMDFTEVSEVDYNGLHLYCYRTTEGLVPDTWRFSIVLE